MIRRLIIDPDEPVPIRSYSYEYEAEVARLALEAAGIPCILLRNTFSEVAGGTRLAVRRRDVGEACELIDPPAESEQNAQ